MMGRRSVSLSRRRQGTPGRMLALLVALLLCVMARPAMAQAVAAMSMRNVERDGPGRPVMVRSEGRSGGPDSRRTDFRNPASDAEDYGLTAEPPPPASFWEGWGGSVEGGVNGASGNSENFNLRMGFSAQRRTVPMETSVTGSYTWSTDGGEKTKSRGELEGRNDWNMGESPWFVFAVGRVEYDEFQDWRWRLSGIAGPGYTLVRSERTTLKLRSGLGASRELGGSRNEIIPELDLGLDLEHKLTEHQKIYLTHDSYPSIEEFSDFRSVTKAGWEILVDPESNLLLRLGVEHRHQSRPGEGFKKNDLDYFALIGWQF
ncbi:MAG: DUF481 domain-containing protein [Phycisphaerales bacterium]|nr:DUF481 domain-containing protein [Phycisphaerales bacterium]